MEIELDKSFRERIFHAVIFEVTANIIIALSLAWLMNVSILQSGSLSVISALTATAWNFVFNKLITGNFRMGVSRQLIIKAVAQFLNKDEKDTAHQLMGKWNPEEETVETLFGSQQKERHYLPYPFFLAYPLEAAPDEALGDLSEWFFEKKYDGIRGQIILRNNQVFVWSRGEELVTDKFPEFETLYQHLPDGTVIECEDVVKHWLKTQYSETSELNIDK